MASKRYGKGAAEEVELGRAYLELKQQYDDLVGKNLAGVYRTTLAGRFLECNSSMAHMLGYADRNALMLVSAKDLYMHAAEREEFINELRERRQLVNFSTTLKHTSGRSVHVLESVFISEPHDRPATIEGTLIDISNIHQAEVEQRALLNNYRQLMDRVRDGILIVQRGVIQYANPAAEKLIMNEHPLGEEFEEMVHPEDRERVAAAVNSTDEGISPASIELRMGKPSGPWYEVVLEASHTLHNGSPAVQITLQDPGLQESLMHERTRARIAEQVNEVLRQEINEHRRTQEALRQSRRFARSLIDSSLDVIIAVDQQGIITEFNPAATIKFGYEAEEVIGKPSKILYYDEAEFERLQTELNLHGAVASELQNVTRDGRIFTSFLAASRLYDEDGKLLGSMGVSRDITQAKRDQEAMRMSEERYRDLFENATDLIQSVDAEGHFQYVNAAWKEALGYTDAELRSMTIWDIVAPEERAHCEALFARVMSGESIEQLRTLFVTKDGRRVLVEGNSNARIVDGRPLATRSIFRDITSVQAAREEVMDHRAKQRALFESSEHMFWTVDKRIALTSFNRGYSEMIERLYGTRPELNGDLSSPRRRFAPAEYHAFWERKYAEAFAGKAIRFETDVRDHSGVRVCNEIFLSPVFEADGSVDEVFGIGHEITEQKEAEDTVREQEARMKAIFENSANMMIWTLDRDFRITAFNGLFKASNERGMGVSFKRGDDFIKVMMERVADQRYGPIVAKYAEALKGIPQQFEVELKNGQGRSLWVENFLNPITIDGEVVEISCLAHGITDKKEAQKKLVESLNEKEILLKEVHHRVKNNLQIISSILNLQGSYVDDDPRMLELLRESQDRIRSMSFIHESLYQTKNFSHVDLANYIDGLTRNLMMSYSLSGKIELDKDLEHVELGLDQAIPCGLILNELISNTLKHAYPIDGAGRIHITLRQQNGQVEISIGDDGKGLPEGFDDERDANLGLQLVHTLIDQLDGRISRRSSGSSGSGGGGVSYLITFGRTK